MSCPLYVKNQQRHRWIHIHILEGIWEANIIHWKYWQRWGVAYKSRIKTEIDVYIVTFFQRPTFLIGNIEDDEVCPMYIYLQECMRVCTCVWMCTIGKFTCIHICMHMYMDMCIYVHLCAYMYITYLRIFICVYVYMHMHVLKCIHVHLQIFTCNSHVLQWKELNFRPDPQLRGPKTKLKWPQPNYEDPN